MRAATAVALTALALVPLPALAAGQADGPRATSAEVTSDAVGFAGILRTPPTGRWSDVPIAVAYPKLAAGSFVEVTALDSGRTILALVVDGAVDGAVVALSPGAAQQLGVGDRAPVRVRSAVPTPQDQAALRAGKLVGPRLDAPAALLTALRHRLPGERAVQPTATAQAGSGSSLPAAPPPPPAIRSPHSTPAHTTTTALPTPPPPPPPPVAKPAARAPAPTTAKPKRGSLMIQVAALSSAERAQALARDLGGRVVGGAGLYRVQLGPYGDQQSTNRARDALARRGYGDARIVRAN